MKKLLILVSIAFLSTGMFAKGPWTVLKSGTTQHLMSVYALSETNCYVAGYGGVIKQTTDGGKTWTNETSGTSNRLYVIKFTNSTNGYAVGDFGTAIRTSNKRANKWVKMNVTKNTGMYFRSIYFVDEKIGYIGGAPSSLVGYLYKTIDGGSTWNTLKIPSIKTINNIKFVDKNNGYCVGLHGIMILTKDGGKTWTSQNHSPAQYNGVDFPTAKTGVTIGRIGDIRRTTDAGKTWKTIYKGTTTEEWAASIDFADDKFGMITGGSLRGNKGYAKITEDGGKTWKSDNPTSKRLGTIHFASNKIAYVVGLTGTILKYTRNIVSINKVKEIYLAKVYPNPVANNVLNIELPATMNVQKITFNIYSIQGKLIKSFIKTNSTTIVLSLNNFKSGNYILTTSSNGKAIKSERIVVVN